MSKSPIDYLQHILMECVFIQSVLPDEIDKEKFLSDETLKRAIVRSLEIIGEAANRILKIDSKSEQNWLSLLVGNPKSFRISCSS